MIHDILKRLREEIPAQYVKFLSKGGNNKITYISWYDTARILDERLGNDGLWHWAIDKVSNSADRIYIVGTLTIESFEDNKKVCFSATGTEELNMKGYGDPSSNAEAMAFKRASAKSGLGRQFYYKDEPVNKPSNNNGSNQNINPLTWRFPFGKYKGQTISEVKQVDAKYLTWLLKEGKPETVSILRAYKEMTK